MNVVEQWCQIYGGMRDEVLDELLDEVLDEVLWGNEVL